MDLSVIDVVVALLSVGIGWYIGVRSERLSKSQYRLSASAFATDWFRDLRTWASEAVDVLSEAIYHSPDQDKTEPMAQGQAVQCRSRLSALVDRGRFFIPNYMLDEFGQHKPTAYRGVRHPALDYLVAAEQVIAGHAPEVPAVFPTAREALTELRRAFVSEIQDILDPRAQNKAIAEFLKLSENQAADSHTSFQRLAQNYHHVPGDK